MKNLKFATMVILLPAVALALAGCWTPPNANVQPAGEPRLIQSGITVEVVQNPAPVASIDASQRTITLKRTDGLTKTYAVGPKVQNFDQIKAGNYNLDLKNPHNSDTGPGDVDHLLPEYEKLLEEITETRAKLKQELHDALTATAENTE